MELNIISSITSSKFNTPFKYNIPDNKEIQITFQKILGSNDILVKDRETIDMNSFSSVEKIILSNDSVYILKSVSEIMKSEISVHKYVNNYRINAPYFFYGKLSDSSDPRNKSKCNYIIMEYISDYLHLYNILEDELYFEAVRLLGELHLGSMQRMKKLKESKIPEYSVQWYIDNISKIIFEISRFAIKHASPDSVLLPKKLIADLHQKIPKIMEYLNEIADIPLSLVHGDFDSGNIIFFKKGTHGGFVKAIDWGHGHIGSPLIDIAHLVNSLGYVNYDTKIKLISEYLKACRPIYGNHNIPFSFLIIGGTILHYFYHLNFKLKAIKGKYVEPSFFREQIHNRIIQLLQILV
jgi:hypothetical protein